MDFIKQLVSTTIAAMSASGRTLDTFVISHLEDGINVQQLLRLSPKHARSCFLQATLLDSHFESKVWD